MTSKTADWGSEHVAMHTGKFYWEVQDNSQTAKAAYGVCNNQYYEENGYQVGVNSIYPGNGSYGSYAYFTNGQYITGELSGAYGSSGSADIYGMAFDADTGTMWVSWKLVRRRYIVQLLQVPLLILFLQVLLEPISIQQLLLMTLHIIK